jgi:putative hydrolase of the HAD superfamily
MPAPHDHHILRLRSIPSRRVADLHWKRVLGELVRLVGPARGSDGDLSGMCDHSERHIWKNGRPAIDQDAKAGENPRSGIGYTIRIRGTSPLFYYFSNLGIIALFCQMGQPGFIADAHLTVAMKAVLFDLGHTLIDYYCDWKGPEEKGVDLIFQISRECSPHIDHQEFTSYLNGRLREARELKYTKYVEVPLIEVIGDCLDRYGCLDEDSLQRGLEAFYGVLLEDRTLVEGAVELLGRIKERGLAIGLISDVAWGLPSEFPMRDIRHYGLDAFFDDYVFSTDVGLRKPHPKIFKIALSNLGVEASDAMYVGNSIAQDVRGAKGVGMRSVLKASRYCPQADGVVPDHTVSHLAEVEGLLDQ